MSQIIETLSSDLVCQCFKNALDRNCKKRAAGVVDRKIGPQNTLQIDINGAGAEGAYAQHHDLPLHQLNEFNLSGDDGADFDHHLKRVDLKTRFPDPELPNRPLEYFMISERTMTQWSKYTYSNGIIGKKPPDLIVCLQPLDKIILGDGPYFISTKFLFCGWCTLEEFRTNGGPYNREAGGDQAPNSTKNSWRLHQNFLHSIDEYQF